MHQNIRRATIQQAQQLSTLCLRSKASWGYDAAFMKKVEPSFVISEQYITDWPVYVVEEAGTPLGFYGFRIIGDEPFLCDLWIAPEWIGCGLGKQLWLHALGVAIGEKYGYFLIESDPNAEAFYLHMGAVRIGTIKSADSGRMLPLLRMDLPAR